MIETQEKIEEKKTDLTGPIVLFAVKTCIVAVVVTACVVFAADWVIGSAEHSFARSVRSIQQISIGGRKFWSRLEEELDRAAAPASDLPPERKQKLINNVRILAARWRPLIDALQDGKQAPAATTSETGK
jgi:hypothetical protein